MQTPFRHQLGRFQTKTVLASTLLLIYPLRHEKAPHVQTITINVVNLSARKKLLALSNNDTKVSTSPRTHP